MKKMLFLIMLYLLLDFGFTVGIFKVLNIQFGIGLGQSKQMPDPLGPTLSLLLQQRAPAEHRPDCSPAYLEKK